jgi:hypothetical protein
MVGIDEELEAANQAQAVISTLPISRKYQLTIAKPLGRRCRSAMLRASSTTRVSP